jgi:hypothetical protein
MRVWQKKRTVDHPFCTTQKVVRFVRAVKISKLRQRRHHMGLVCAVQQFVGGQDTVSA